MRHLSQEFLPILLNLRYSVLLKQELAMSGTNSSEIKEQDHRIALLFSLADMAARAASMPGALCFLLVWILRPAETAMRDYLFAGDPDNIDPETPLGGVPSAAAAMALADSFCELALALENLSRDEQKFADWRRSRVSGGTVAVCESCGMAPWPVTTIGRLIFRRRSPNWTAPPIADTS
jgi:hypothetical protein